MLNVFASSPTRAGMQAKAIREQEERVTLQKMARAKDRVSVREARERADAFVEYALRSEADDSRLVNAPFHVEWHRHLDAHDYAVLIAPIEHAKSIQIAVARTLHRLGQDPNRRVALISNTGLLAEKLLRQIRVEIERNPRVHRVFPNLRRSTHKEAKWNQSAITVERQIRARDPSVQALGVFGPIVGSRLDTIILDDVIDFENSRSEIQRKKLIEWFDTTVFTRLVRGGVIWAIGTPWHPDDFLHELEKRPGFASKRYSAALNPDDPPKKWIPLWPDQWDLRRLLDRRDNTPESVFMRKYLCRVRLDSISRFRQVWLERMCKLGQGRTFLAKAPRAHVRGPVLPCFTGVDLGVGDKDDNAQTVIFTLALMPNGQRLVVDIEAGRWQAPEIIERLETAYRNFNSDILVESNGAQMFLIDMCEGRVPVHAHNTGSNKHHEQFGVESLAVEMRNGLWLMPSGREGKMETVEPEGLAFIRECLYYDPDPKAHTGDRLMAAWLAREAVRAYAGGSVQQHDMQRR